MESIKGQLIECIQKMELDTIVSTRQRVEKLFDLIDISRSLWGFIPDFKIPYIYDENENIESPLNDNKNKIKTSPIEETPNQAIEIKDPLIATRSYPLNRKLKGGFLATANGDVFVPEKVIRSSGLIHGDYIEPITKDNKTFVYIKQKDSSTAHECKRVELPHCVLSTTSDGYLVANQQLINNKLTTIKLDGQTPFQFLIRDNEIQALQLKDGMVVAIAYLENNVTSYRVTWSYPDLMQKFLMAKIKMK